MPLFWVYILYYFVFTGLLALVTHPALFLNNSFISNRAIFIIAFTILYYIKQKIRPAKLFITTNILICYALLTLLYKETELLHIMPSQKIDFLLSQADLKLLGYHPSVMFSKNIQTPLFSELMFAGYFFYYLTPLAVIFINYKLPCEKQQEFGFILIASFLFYYALFILLPAAGPQFYFPYPDNYIEAKGVFGNMMKFIQARGEAPTAAFPSSHVAISITILIWLYCNNRKFFYCQLPFTGILLLATVYIKAHYVTDVIAGIFTAPLVLYMNIQIYKRLKTRYLLWK